MSNTPATVESGLMTILISEIKTNLNQRLRKAKSDKVAEIARSIKDIGLINPITVDKDYNLIAGLHRLEACKLLEMDKIPCNILEFDDANKQRLAEIDENLVRNNLTVREHSRWINLRKKIYEKINPDTKKGAKNQYTKDKDLLSPDSRLSKKKSFVEDTINKTGRSRSGIYQDIQIDENITKETDKIISGTELENQKTNLLEISKLKPEKQVRVAEEIVKSDFQKSVKNVLNEIKREENKKKQEQVRAERKALEMPTDKYEVIYADPPWRYDFSKDSSDDIENHYPTMDIEELKTLEIPSDTNCVLYMWATAPKLIEAIELIKAWGFTYKTHAVWDKMSIGMGYWFRGQHELLLIATKGSFRPPETDFRYASVYSEKKTRHSRKPDYFAKIIESAFPNHSKIELFCRNPRDGWAVFGNENNL